MSVNKYQPHVFVLPEDDANRQLANGFVLSEHVATRKIQVLPEAGGWSKVLEHFLSVHAAAMDRYPGRCMVLLLDFDGRQERLNDAKARIPETLKAIGPFCTW